MLIIEDKLDYNIKKNKTKLIDLFAPYLLENKKASVFTEAFTFNSNSTQLSYWFSF